MAGSTSRARSGLIWLTVAVMFATLLAPAAALADTNLEIGGMAVIAYANGDDVRLRAEPGYSGDVIRMVREGASVDVYDGPFEDSDGNFWYQVGYDGDSGYIVSDYLALNGGVGADDSIFNPASESIGAALIAGTNNDGVRCRAAADPGAAVITVVPEGAIVEIIGGAIDVWQPINCAGQSGYVHLDYVSWDLDGGVEAASESDAVIGEAFVAGTNGDGVRCRASASYDSSIITVLSEGSSVALRDVVRGDFQGVVCAGQNGFAASMYLSADGSTVGEASGDDVVGEAFVSGTNGDGVRCRSGAGTDASVITVLAEGTAVALRSGGGDGWQPIICAGSNGFVAAEYLSSSNDGGSGGGEATGDATISGTNGDGVRCRAQASFSGDVLTVLFEGEGVGLRGDQDGDWIAVVCDGMNGWVHGDYVGSGGGSDGGDSGGAPSNASFSAGDDVMVAGTNGDGVRLRASGSSSAAIISVLSEGASATVIDGSTGDWVAVSANGTSGFVHMDYLSSEARVGDDSGGETDSGGSLSSGDHAVALSALNLRYDPSFSGGVAAVVPSGTVVQVTGRANDGFYPVDWDGLQGYMHGDYLSWTDEALSARGGSGDGGGGESGGGGDAVGSSSVVDFAMQYLGYPYVWATHGPSSFDCSGFTYWVLSNTLGVNIGTGTASQIGYGTPIDRNNLQPGDLVFFQNTYTWGLSHVGIYIGGSQFIHAENPSTGVVISDLDSSYYASRWYGARRVG